MMGLLIDTSIAIRILRGSERVVAAYEALSKKHGEKAITAYTVAELREGILKSTRPAQSKLEDRLLDVFFDDLAKRNAIHSLTPQAARLYAKLKIALEQRGTPIPVFDLLIGTIAIDRGLKLVTTDDGHFGHLKKISPDLDVVYLHE
jgi:tRNA(fMet)-specific endonuclease VapC